MHRKWPEKVTAYVLMFGMSVFGFGAPARAGNDRGNGADAIKTATPIKHVIIIVGENRSFDHLFAIYVPQRKDERVLNLLSEGIINADGTPGPNFAKAHQYKIVSAPNGGKFFSSTDMANNELYSTLPAPDVNGVQNPPAAVLLSLGGDPGLAPQDQFLMGTGGTGLPFSEGPDTRIPNVLSLLPGPFQLTGPNLPFDAYAGDTVHQYFQMVQQVDCAIDAEHVSKDNPTGCLHDLQSAIDTTYATPLGGTPHDTGQTMEFFNMQSGDAPLFKTLADKYTMSDNYHQPVLGGTGPDSHSALLIRCSSAMEMAILQRRRRRIFIILIPCLARSTSIPTGRNGSTATTPPSLASLRSRII
jgi:phospholipase C